MPVPLPRRFSRPSIAVWPLWSRGQFRSDKNHSTASCLVMLLELVVTAVSALVGSFALMLWNAHNKMPGLKWADGYHWLWGNMNHMNNLSPEENHYYAGDNALKHGGMCKFRFLADTYVTVADPVDAVDVLKNDITNYTHGEVYSYFKPWLGNGLLCSEGTEWEWKRKKMNSAFAPSCLRRLFPIFDEVVNRLIQQFEQRDPKKTYDLMVDFVSLTLDGVGMAAFGFDFNAQQGSMSTVSEAFMSIMIAQQERLKVAWMPAWLYRLTADGKKFYKDCDYIRDITRNVIVNRHKLSEEERAEKHDLLSRLMEKGTGRAYNDAQLADEICTLVFAGHESTSTLLMMTAYEVAKNPDIEKRIFEEIDRLIGDRDPTELDLPKLTYLTMVLKEVLRLYTPVPGIGKKTSTSVKIHGSEVPEGTDVDISLRACHVNPKYWDRPDEFDPERFSSENLSKIPKNAYIPFAAGKRNCIGQNFAMMEAQLVFAKIFQKFTFRLPEGFELKLFTMINTKPIGGLPLHIIRRSSL